MDDHTVYSPKSWRMKWVVPYLLKYYFEKKPTSNKDLREAFWKLMGKDISGPKGKIHWTSKPTGVPSKIHQLVKKGIIAIEPESNREIEYKNYVLGPEAEKYIKEFTSKYNRSIIDEEIEKYLGKKIKSVNDNGANERADIIDEGYLPTKEDCEYIMNQHSKNEASYDELLDDIETSLEDKGVQLKKEWRKQTEENFDIWSNNNKEK
ncbi:MAG: hypothetical protein KKI12_11650 [Proteobacteria bacterium]|nr:hypothetical protein [Pseudomonadota bacterium]